MYVFKLKVIIFNGLSVFWCEWQMVESREVRRIVF